MYKTESRQKNLYSGVNNFTYSYSLVGKIGLHFATDCITCRCLWRLIVKSHWFLRVPA